MIQTILSYLNIVLTIGLIIGGVFAFRKGYSKEMVDIQNRVIDALKEEVATLRLKVNNLEKERSTQDSVNATVRYALRQYGLRVTISEDFVRISKVGESTTTRIKVRPPAAKDEQDEQDETT